MMLQIIGACCLVFAGGLFARGKTSDMKDHLAMLSSLMSALHIMICEIQTNLTPMGEIIRTLALSKDKYFALFFSEVSEQLAVQGAPYFAGCWKAAVDSRCSILTPAERDALYILGDVLGRYDAAEECAAIERCILELNTGYEALRRRYHADARLYTGIGLAAGCILAIVLL